jgi:hypothetical protein
VAEALPVLAMESRDRGLERDESMASDRPRCRVPMPARHSAGRRSLDPQAPPGDHSAKIAADSAARRREAAAELRDVDPASREHRLHGSRR